MCFYKSLHSLLIIFAGCASMVRSTLEEKCWHFYQPKFCGKLPLSITVHLLGIFQGLLHFLSHLLNGTLSLPLWKEIYFVQNYHHLLAGNLPNYQALC